jgi:hypothetical protein
MLVACRRAGRSALETHYAGLVALTQTAPTIRRDGVGAIVAISSGAVTNVTMKAIRAAAATTSALLSITLPQL